MVKKKLFGNEKVIKEIQGDVIRKLRSDEEARWSRNFPKLHEKILQMCVTVVPTTDRIIPKPVSFSFSYRVKVTFQGIWDWIVGGPG